MGLSDETRPGNDPSDYLMEKLKVRDKHTENEDNSGRILGKRSSSDGIRHLLLDTLLTLPSVAFITYAFLVVVNNGRPIDQSPIPLLRTAAIYSPTLFPIAFSAVAASFLKAAAAWRLEQGISVLSLEYLLNCRTVFSAFTTPMSLRAVNRLTPLLIILWVLSPLGGQAALRVMEMVPSTATEPWLFQNLEFMSAFRHSGPQSSAGFSLLPSIQSAFVTALGTPADIKAEPQDLFGNIKIPMVEAFQNLRQTQDDDKKSDNRQDDDGWFHLDSKSAMSPVWSSIAGIPVATLGGLSSKANYSFAFETSYIYADCSLQRGTPMNFTEWASYRQEGPGRYSTNRTLVISTNRPPLPFDQNPLELVFTSFVSTQELTTNASCVLRTTYVEVDVGCHGTTCGTRHVRPLQKPDDMTIRTVLNNMAPEGQLGHGTAGLFDGFMSTFVRSGLSLWDLQEGRQLKPFASALETYFTEPDSPYSASGISSWDGTDIYPVGDRVFSQRFSQLLNTFWLASVASHNITGNFHFQSNGETSLPAPIITQNITGTRTPDFLVMRVNDGWMLTLFVASTAMLISGVIAAVLGSMRRGPDVLDHPTFFSRDSPYVNVSPCYSGSVEDASEQVRRTRDMRVCIGDVSPAEEMGHLAFGTVNEAVPLGLQKDGRCYA
ncbi:hypothetical protein GCG54_00009795 [Colletotrichum gloeosporioides]|uniref:Transmembrane protein n=1 Tax=Colletotrichum gloeosporioides TaxID=474922 RepID=A0A8H4CXY6_COLGL|nr:uncharacterized protein GCG54_00009795 [Colletotrichum gloeosporioides]KAF3812111.1 hypothetical protein GCG54_00009795 [Colletotrichum gloeosporioides]